MFRAVESLTAEWLQRVIDCHLAPRWRLKRTVYTKNTGSEGPGQGVACEQFFNPSDATPLLLLVCALVAIAVFYFWSDHRAHLWGGLPYALLIACPFLHFLMHRKHERAGAAPANQAVHTKHTGQP